MSVALDGRAYQAAALRPQELASATGAVRIQLSGGGSGGGGGGGGGSGGGTGQSSGGDYGRLRVVAGGLSFAVRAAPAKKFKEVADQIRHLHLDLSVLGALPQSAEGVFAELALMRPLTEATRAKVSVVSPRSQPPHWRDYGDAPLSAMRPDSLPISLGGTLSQPVAPMHFVKAC